MNRFEPIDCHVHPGGLDALDALRALRRGLGFAAMNLACIVNPRTGSGHTVGLCAKAAEPGHFYCFGGLHHAAKASEGKVFAPPLAEQLDNLLAAGCDGVKLIEAKPTGRVAPLDGPYFADFFARAEALQVPLLWHVADPEEFWDPATTPEWARKHNWGYGPQTVPKERLYAEVEAVLNRHARLRVVFAHFYFLSADLKRAADFLARHPSVNLDLAPGVEMLFNMSRDPEAARAFFIKHQGRILFGTDIWAAQPLAQAAARAGIVREFLEGDRTFTVPAEADELLEPGGSKPICGLNLPKAALEKIYRGNFEALAGREPKPVNLAAAQEECRRNTALAAAISGLAPDQTDSAKCLKFLARAG